MIILAIDPGTNETGWCLYGTGEHRVLECGVTENNEFLEMLRKGSPLVNLEYACEMIASYGMPVGREVFETCVMIGRIEEIAHGHNRNFSKVYRKDVKMEICGSPRAKDPNIRRAILDEFPATGGGATPQVGTSKLPGPLYGVKSHIWAALGVAITHAKQKQVYVGNNNASQS